MHRNGGRLVTCGATTGGEVPFNLTHLFARQLTFEGSFMGEMSELWDALRCFDRGLLRTVVDRVFPLEEASAAHAYLAEKKQFGKVVLSL